MKYLIALMSLIMLFSTAIWSAAQEPHGVHPEWNEPIQVSNTNGDSGGVVGRNFAIDSNNTLHIVWAEQHDNNFDVYYSRSYDDGQTWEDGRDLFPDARLPAFGPNLVIGPDDTLHIVWTDRREGTAREYYSRSLDGGETWEDPRNISGDHTRDASEHVLSVDDNNRVHVVWHIGDPAEDTEATNVYYIRSLDGGANFESVRQLNTGDGHAAFPRFSVEGTSGDVIAISWRDNRREVDWDVYLAVSIDGGTTFTEKIGHADPNVREWDPESIVDPHGTIHMAYMVNSVPREEQIDYLYSTDFGETWSSPVTVSEAGSRFPFWAQDHDHGVMWLFWKDERDFLTDSCPRPSRCADIAGRYTMDGGLTWSEMEFVTDLGSTEAKLPSQIVAPSGRAYSLWSAINPDTGREAVYFTSRRSAPH